MNTHVDSIERLAAAFVESYIEAYEASAVAIDAADVEDIVRELRDAVETWFRSLRARPHMARFLSAQPSDPASVVAKCRQTLTLKVNEVTLAQERATAEALEREILVKMSEQPGITYTLAQLKTNLPALSGMGDGHWRVSLERLGRRGFVSTRTPAGPFYLTRQGQSHAELLKRESRRTSETIMGDKYEIRGQVGAVGPYSQVRNSEFVQLWDQAKESIDLTQLAEELTRLREAMVPRANTAEEHAALGNVASAEIAVKEGHGPRVLEHLRKAGRFALDIARAIGAEVAATALKRACGL